MLSNVSSNNVENCSRCPPACKADTAKRIPRKKRILGVSIRCRTLTMDKEFLRLSGLWRWRISVNTQRTPTAHNIHINGGKCVIVLKNGTNNNHPTPRSETRRKGKE